MTDTNTLAPTDAELMQVIKDVAKNSAINRDGSTSLRIARAVLAKWGAPAPASPPVAVPEPHYGNGRYLGFARHNDAYSVAQVQAMLAAVPRNATLYDPDDVAFSARCCADGTDVLPPELASTDAAQKGGQHGTE